MALFNRVPLIIFTAVLSVCMLTSGLAAAEVDLAEFDLEDLMSMEVTSVSKKAERAFEAPAAAFVITSEDIRRSGLRSIPELLRLVPGIQVARLGTSWYATSVRGFGTTFSSKLLVLIDGRSVYTPLFAGVFWDVQDVPLHDIDRIEVIRGPGGTVWGANAVNGVINIVTKAAGDSQGWHIETGFGDFERAGSGTIRYGGRIGDDIDFRVYLKHFDREQLHKDSFDDAKQVRGGFRMDAKVGDRGSMTLQGDLYHGTENGIVAGGQDTTKHGGGNILARYTHEFSETHNASLQFYYDRTDRNTDIILYELDTIDLELKHQIKPLAWLDFVWGFEYRHRSDHSRTGNPANYNPVLPLFGLPDVIIIDPSKRKTNLFSGFVQAEARAWDDKIRLTLGTKLEDNSTSGFEIQPSARLAFVPNERVTLWASVARAVRTPSRANDDIDTVGQTSLELPSQNFGNPDSEAEDLMAYEGGIRLQPMDWLHFDLAGFYNDYDDLLVSDLVSVTMVDPDGGGPIPLTPVIRTVGSNAASGVAWGFELFGRVQIPVEHSMLKKWWVDGTYSYIDVDVNRDNMLAIPAVFGTDSALDSGVSEAHHTIGLRSHMNFVHELELDLAYSYVSEVENVGGSKVKGYHRFDLRTAWRPIEHVEVSFSVQNVFDGGHYEWNSELFIPTTKIPRTFYAKVALDF